MTETERQLAQALQEGPTMRSAPVSAGNRVEDFLRRFLPRVTAERLAAPVDPILQYGPIPAQAAVEMAKQPARAGEAVGEAITDPTLANVTNAGVQTGAALMPVARGAGAALTAGSAALGYGEAARRDFAQPATANAQGAARDLGTMVKGNPEAEAMYAEVLRLEGEGKANVAGRSREESDRIRSQARGQADKVRNDLMKLLSDKASTEEGKKLSQYNQAVATAKAARDEEMKRNTRFADSNIGHVWEKTGVLTPAAAAAGVVGLGQLAARMGGTSMSPKAATGIGVLTAVPVSNYPLLSDGYLDTQSYNPVKRAEERYAFELPEGHPDKEKTANYAAKMPDYNPIRKAAQDDFLNPVGIAGRTAIGIAEGVGGGHVGKYAADILTKGPGFVAEGLARLPGRMTRAYREEMNAVPPRTPQATPANPVGPTIVDEGSGPRVPPREPRQDLISDPLGGQVLQRGPRFSPARKEFVDDYMANEMATGNVPSLNATIKAMKDANIPVPDKQRVKERVEAARAIYSTLKEQGQLPPDQIASTVRKLLADPNVKLPAIAAGLGIAGYSYGED